MGTLFQIHRWSGLTVGFMALVWFASGIVVHWYEMADPSDEEYLRGHRPWLEPEELAAVDWPVADRLGGEPLAGVALYRLGDRLVWQLRRPGDAAGYGVGTYWGYGGSGLVDARSGERMPGVSERTAALVAARVMDGGGAAADGRPRVVAGSGEGGEGKVESPLEVARLEGHTEFYRYGPLPAFRISFPEARTDVYVAESTGEVGAVIGPRERLTRVFGGMPHFLAFAPVNSSRAVYLVVMGILIAGVVAGAVSGLVYGAWAVGRRRRFGAATGAGAAPGLDEEEGESPRGDAVRTGAGLPGWHHWLGLGLGALVVTWALSGALMIWYPSVDPTPDELRRLAEPPLQIEAIGFSPAEALETVGRTDDRPVAVLAARMLEGRPVLEARHPSGRRTLLDGGTGRVLSPLPEAAAVRIVERYVGASVDVRSVRLLESQDEYYFGLHGRRRPLPVHRVDLATDGLPSPLYVHAETGALVGRVTSEYRFFRWLGSAVHTFSFPALLRRPALWDVAVVVPALLGVLLAGSGLWLGVRRLFRRRVRTTDSCN